MLIIHKIDDFLFTIFPNLSGGGKSQIISALEKYYTYGPFKPKITVEDELVKIEIDTPAIITQESDYRKAVNYCENRRYKEAKPILEKLIRENPTNSEYHRIMGQILSDEGNQEEAIDILIEALRWDPKNTFALIMMGNILAKHKEDISTALKYYNQVIEIEPGNHIAINNIGAFLMQQDKATEAKTYFERALSINPDYPNTHYAMALIAEKENDLPSAFYCAITAIKKSKSRRDELEQQATGLVYKAAKQLVQSGAGKHLFNEYLHKLEFQWDIKIKAIVDDNISTAAKLELAENYNRDHHLIRYKSKYPVHEHLTMHELVHLQLMMEARREDANHVFVSTSEGKKKFITDNRKWIEKMNKTGMTEESVSNVISDLFDGINRQLFNTPIDLFIEDFLYNEYQELRPYQFLSLSNLMGEAIQAVTEKKIVDVSPEMVLRNSKILNLVSAMHFRDLYGIDLTSVFNSSKAEMNTARNMFGEFLEYRDDREPGEEYELVQHWGKDLKLDAYFVMHDEKSYRKSKSDINTILKDIENDPFGLESDQAEKQLLMDQFLESQKDIGVNMAVVMHMVDALKYFDKLSPDKVKSIAFEIAMIGTQGITPDKEGYVVGLIPGKSFSGYHLLAYYYVSWSLAIPEMLEGLKMPYKEEFKLAKTLHKSSE